ncbi:MAG: glycosyltransferase [Cellvibrionaceae bacterium]|nr:glycosyltransferase [Cellvibrionaceae bacterium]
MNDRIEVTIPVLNEERTLEQQVLKVLEHFQAQLNRFEDINLVIADNGSTDRTPEIARRLEAQYHNVKYLRLDKRGVGLALKSSWGASGADIVGYMDLDLATDLRHLGEALDILVSRKADMVAGSRLARGAKVIGRSPVREVTSRAFNMIVKTWFRTKFTDGMCGFKFLRRSCLPELMRRGACNDGWFFSTELLVVAEHLKMKVEDLPVTWTDDPDSKVKIGRLAIEYLKAMRALKAKLKNSVLDAAHE